MKKLYEDIITLKEDIYFNEIKGISTEIDEDHCESCTWSI